MTAEKPARSVAGFVFRLTVSIAVLFFSIGGAILCCTATAPPTQLVMEVAIPTVQVETVAEQMDGLTFEVDGTVVPYREVPLASEVSGRVVFLAEHCRVGRYVETGEVLAKIDPTDYELALAEARQQQVQSERAIIELDTNIVNAKTQLATASQQLAIQRRDVERVQKLSKNGAISQMEMDTTMLTELQKIDAVQTLENQIRTYETQKERLVACMKLSEVQVQKAEINLQRCVIKAPLDGVVTELGTEQDKYINRGEKLVTIHDTSRVEVRCSLYMKHVEWLWSTRKETEKDPRNYYQFPKTPVTVLYTMGETEYRWNGTLEYLDGAGLDARTRMMPCRVVVSDPLAVESNATGLANATPALLPGMFVQVRVRVVPQRQLLNLSEMAILPGGTVWKVLDNKMQQVCVKTAQRDGNRVLVYAEPNIIAPGDRVIVSPLAAPADGAQVKIVE